MYNPFDPAWAPRLQAALAGQILQPVYQPVVDVARGSVVGYEALSRFPGQPNRSPEVWFSVARAHGVGAELEAVALRAGLAARSRLPRNCFLTINVSPDHLASEPIRQVLADEGDLGGLVVELTEQTPIESYSGLEADLSRIRAAGAMLAVDDAGAGYAGLAHLLNLRPSIIKLDRSLVSRIDRDEAKRALVEMIGLFGSRIDAWLLAEGIEREEELDVIASLRVPLAQGFVFGQPGSPWAPIPPDLAARLVMRASLPDDGTSLRHLMELAPTAVALRSAATLLAADYVDAVVMLDGTGRPVGLADASSVALSAPADALVANVDTPVREAARRCLTRHRWERFHPIVCTDNAGRYVGIVRVERLISELADS